ncbi:hypothetical protein CIPAW_01G207900 [Carya illinoinensis]|uniref:RNase H type-1 domain-containing protein n=1 Tax=Carya illinoinensis TaxID=32201 RepID=A0A8T1RRU4_CARIL|nr:hypothetical protein CIPAW_01G207900 [Carya illinoinensis]
MTLKSATQHQHGRLKTRRSWQWDGAMNSSGRRIGKNQIRRLKWITLNDPHQSMMLRTNQKTKNGPFFSEEGEGSKGGEETAAPMVLAEEVNDLDYPQLMAMGEKFEKAAAKMTRNTAHSAVTGGDGASSRQIIMGNPTYQPASRMDSGIPGPINLDGCRLPPGYTSPTKMKAAVKEVDFLGATIADRKVRLQPHIIRKIADVSNESLKTLKGLRSWLGVINYTRAHIPKCGTLLGPLYQKVGAHGDKKWTDSDWRLVAQIKDMVQKLPDLELPPKECHIILETDGCMEGWGGICKWAPYKGTPKGKEKVCAYASGKFPNPKSTIDAEIYAVMETMESLKIYYLDQKEITIRTDCQAIISFHDKQSHKKPSRVR